MAVAPLNTRRIVSDENREAEDSHRAVFATCRYTNYKAFLTKIYFFQLIFIKNGCAA